MMRTNAEPEWVPDRLLSGYETTTLPLDGAEPAAGEPDDAPLVGTLLRRDAPSRPGAVVYLHGWNDYFFHPHVGDFFDGLDRDFYAIELRRYGRSLAPGQYKGFISDLSDYFAELDAAMEIVAAHHDEVVLMGHSTGGLVASLWVAERPGRVKALVLNSPWIDLGGSMLMQAATRSVLQRWASSRPTSLLPLPNNGFYVRTLDVAQDGEWTMEPEWKNATDFSPRAAWLAAILAGHAKVKAGLGIEVPVLVMASARSDFRRDWDEALRTVDIVLDVDKMAARAVRLGSCVTVVRIADGIHDLTLSAPEVRARVFAEVERWIGAYA